jgi:hypothetical protein
MERQDLVNLKAMEIALEKIGMLNQVRVSCFELKG